MWSRKVDVTLPEDPSPVYIHYNEGGKWWPKCKTIIFSDLYLNKEGFQEQLWRLRLKYHVFAIDLPGFGDSRSFEPTDTVPTENKTSDPPCYCTDCEGAEGWGVAREEITSYDFQYSYSWYAKHLRVFIEKLQLSNVYLSGTDQVGNIFMKYAQMYKDIDGLIMENAAPGATVSDDGCFNTSNVSTQDAANMKFALENYGDAGKQQIAQTFANAAFKATKCPENEEKFIELTKENFMKIDNKLLVRLLNYTLREDLTAELKNMKIPILTLLTCYLPGPSVIRTFFIARTGQRPYYDPYYYNTVGEKALGDKYGNDCYCSGLEEIEPAPNSYIVEDPGKSFIYHSYDVKGFTRNLKNFIEGEDCDPMYIR